MDSGNPAGGGSEFRCKEGEPDQRYSDKGGETRPRLCDAAPPQADTAIFPLKVSNLRSIVFSGALHFNKSQWW
ncbi:hypothetical protein GJAV_G00014050 [Gymnothorax javanicus]|nr:hypothetical protein GJAV_G00014050 [Gymnothorax javanicus]